MFAGLNKITISAEHVVPWERSRISAQLIRESQLATEYFGIPSLTTEEADEIALAVEDAISQIAPPVLTAPMVREFVNVELIRRGHIGIRAITTRVGMSVADAIEIDRGFGFEAKENANLQENAETGHKKKADKISKEQYLLLLPPHLSNRHLLGDYHIHDLEYFGTRPFCQSWDLRYFFYYGLMPDGTGTKASVAGPAMNAEVAILHAVKVLASAQTNWAGGQGLMDFLTFISPYLEGLGYKEIKQLMQMLVYELTQAYVARGGQLCFTSVQLTPGVPKLWRDRPCVYRGRLWDGKHQAERRVYGEFEREVRLAFKAVMEVMIAGDFWGKPFSFPKPEISIAPEFIDEEVRDSPLYDGDVKIAPSYRELYTLAFTLAATQGTPYFDNTVPPFRQTGGIECYQCCAFTFQVLDSKESFEDKMNFVGGAHFSPGGNQVITLNTVRYAMLAHGDVQAFEDVVKQALEDVGEVFQIKKKWLDVQISNGRIPFMTQRPKDPARVRGTGMGITLGGAAPPAIDREEQVYAIGLVGINETVQALTGEELHESREAWKMGVFIVARIAKMVQDLGEKLGLPIVLARTPAETVAQRFAVADLQHQDKSVRDQARKIVKGDVDRALELIAEGKTDLPVYQTNGAMISNQAMNGAEAVSLFKKAEIEGVFFPLFAGGDIFHIFLKEANPSPAGLMDFAFKLATNTNIGYFTFTRDMTVCKHCSKVASGLKLECPFCGSDKVEWLSRVTGYIQSVSSFNEAKKQELKDRTRYGEEEL